MNKNVRVWIVWGICTLVEIRHFSLTCVFLEHVIQSIPTQKPRAALVAV